MKSTTVALAAILLASTIAALPGTSASKAEGYAWGAQGAPVEAAPGDTGKALTILIRNNATTTFSGVKATISQGYWEGGPGIVPSSAGGVASLTTTFTPGDIWSARFTVDVLPDAIPFAPYEIPVTLDMYDRTNSTFVTEHVTVQVQITGRAALELTLDTTELVAGAETTVRATISSAGTGTASDIRITPTTSQGITILAGDSTQNLGSLRPGQTANVTLRVKALQPGAGALTFTMSYVDAAGSSAQVIRQKTIEIMDPAQPTDDRKVSARILDQDVDAGSTANITFAVINNGTSTLRDVIAKADVGAQGQLVVPDATDQQSLGDIPPGGEARMTLHVITDNDDRGIQRVPLTISWTRDDDSTGTRTFNLAIPIVGTVRPSVTSVTATLNNQTRAASIAGTITNLGNTQALNAYVQILPNTNYQSTEAQFIGDLSPNTAVPFTIATTLLNTTLLNATQTTTPGGGAPAPGAGGFPGGAPPGNGTFPGGGLGTPPANGTFPQGGGNFQRGNGTFPAGGPGGRGGNSVQVLVTWTDDYGKTASEILSMAITPRAASTSTTTRGVSASSEDGSILGIPSPSLGALVGIVAAAAIGSSAYLKRKRS